ncbi:DUF2867 domain-containing protein [Microbacterium sp.]|uniref:DUF2867 domain-containing protein n=1 Tax=Microbacterium sp. TaxID=51671 RepID=UPI003F6F2F22
MRQPAFWSLALAEITDPDFTHVAIGVLPAHATADPAAWARALLSRDALPRWLAALLYVHGVALRTAGRSARCDRFRLGRVEGDEALITLDGRRLDLRVGVGVDEDRALVRVVTTGRIKGGRAWSWPLRSLLPLLVRRMIDRSRRDLSGVTRG